MLNAALIGLGWWGKNILKAVQGRSDKLRFVHAVSHGLDEAKPLAQQHGFTCPATWNRRSPISACKRSSCRGGKIEARDFPPRDSLLAEFDAFAEAAAGRAAYPITPDEMIATIAAFEAVTRSLETNERVRVGNL
jgi:predicted dehydrogenase